MIVGAVTLPLLNVQYHPTTGTNNVTVSFSYMASARVVENEVTSLVEGAMNTLSGVSDTRAVSYNGGGYVSITFKKGTDIETARFDVSTRLRQIRDRLPQGVYPSVGGSISGRNNSTTDVLSYTVNADMPAQQILEYVEKNIVTPISRVDGVEKVTTSGAMPFEWVLTFNPNSLRAAGLSPGDLSAAFNNYFNNSIVGTQVLDDRLMLVRLTTTDLQGELERIPVKMVNDRLYYMGDFAKVTYQEQLPYSYDRINGLNTIDIRVMGQEGINILNVSDAVKLKMEELKEKFPANFAIEQTYDASVSLKSEINRILFRALLSLIILLAFVFAVSRSFRYLFVMSLTIVANLLSAVIFYNLFDIQIELYSMAGITVSLGIIIDTAIVIADHYSYYGNRKVVLSIIGALFTTIAALMVVFFLPESARANLTNFVWVIVINLTISMFVAFLFVPALLDKIPLNAKGVVKSSFKRRRRLIKQTERYTNMVLWGRKHRWVFVLLILLGFGIPIQLLPSKVVHKDMALKDVSYTYYPEEAYKGGLVGLYNSTIGGKWYQQNKLFFEYPLGGALNIFMKARSGSSGFNRNETPEVVLSIYANMSEGCTVQQLNDIVVEMENWLSQFDEISTFRTSLSGTSGRIEVHFKDEYEHTSFPYELKSAAWKKACGYGGATWAIPALDSNDNYLSNSVYRTSWSNSLTLRGYNYDMLYRYAEDLIDSLKANKRVSDAGFSAGYNSFVANEFTLKYDREKIVSNGLNLYRYYSFLGEQLYNSNIGSVFDGTENTPVRLISAERDYFDLWHIRNDMVDIDSVKTRLNDIGSITKRRTGLDIERVNQEYVISVGYEFIGSWELRGAMERYHVDRLNQTLPMGYSVDGESYGFGMDTQKQWTILVLVIIAVIFLICSILFESFKQPFAIIMMIPVSFIGLLLVYPICKSDFGQGGFAAMVMLSGIVVNAGIYITTEYRTVCGAVGKAGVPIYVKAYNRKIVPTLLTILSTVLGLIPFLFDGKSDPFWFSFAIGVMGGMLFSIVAIFITLPVFFPLKSYSSYDN